MTRLGFVLLLLVTSLGAAPVEFLFTAASDAELQPLLARLKDPQIEHQAAWQFWTGTINGKTVALTRTEGDPLNAVAATTLAIRRYQPRLIVTFGAARAHDPALQAGDVVISGKFAAFDGMVSPVQPLGAGSNALTWYKLHHPLISSGEVENRIESFPADTAAMATAQKLTGTRGRIVAGVLGSANQVNREADRIAWIHRQWGTSSEDGESAHVAGCALLFGVPVVGIRVIDGAPGEAGALALKFLEAAP